MNGYKNRHKICVKIIATLLVCLLFVNNISWAIPERMHLAVQSIFSPINGEQIRDIGIVNYYLLCFSKVFDDLTDIPSDVTTQIPNENIKVNFEFSAMNNPEFTDLSDRTKGEYIVPCMIGKVRYYAYITIPKKSNTSSKPAFPLVTVFTEKEFDLFKQKGGIVHGKRKADVEKKIEHEKEIDTPLSIIHGNKGAIKPVPEEVLENILKFFKEFGANASLMKEVRKFIEEGNITIVPNSTSVVLNIGRDKVPIVVEVEKPHVSNKHINIPEETYDDLEQVLIHELSAKCGNPHDFNQSLDEIYRLWYEENNKPEKNVKTGLIAKYPEKAKVIAEMRFKNLRKVKKRDHCKEQDYGIALDEYVTYTNVYKSETLKKVKKKFDLTKIIFNPREVNRLMKTRNLRPKRIDKLITHQSTKTPFQSISELISNGIDASMKETRPIGRFGLGGLQVLSYLLDPKSPALDKGNRVFVETKIPQGPAHKIIFFKDTQGRIRFRIEKSDRKEQGTSVQLVFGKEKDKNFVDKMERELRDKFLLSTRMPIQINGDLINDLKGYKYLNGDSLKHKNPDSSIDISLDEKGIEVLDHGEGMDLDKILNTYLIPRAGRGISKEAPSKEEVEKEIAFFYKPPKDDRHMKDIMKVCLQVSGVKIQSFEIEGIGLPEELVLELPSLSHLNVARNEVEIDAVAHLAVEVFSEKLSSKFPENQDALINGFMAVVRWMDKNNKRVDVRKPLVQVARAKMLDWVQIQQKKDLILFNNEEFYQLKMPDNTRYLDQALLTGLHPSRLPGATRLRNDVEFRPGTCYEAYTVPFKKGWLTASYVVMGDYLLFNQARYNRHKSWPVWLNLRLNLHIGYGPKPPPKGYFIRPEKEGIDKSARVVAGSDRKVADKHVSEKAKEDILKFDLEKHVRSLHSIDKLLPAQKKHLQKYINKTFGNEKELLSYLADMDLWLSILPEVLLPLVRMSDLLKLTPPEFSKALKPDHGLLIKYLHFYADPSKKHHTRNYISNLLNYGLSAEDLKEFKTLSFLFLTFMPSKVFKWIGTGTFEAFNEGLKSLHEQDKQFDIDDPEAWENYTKTIKKAAFYLHTKDAFDLFIERWLRLYTYDTEDPERFEKFLNKRYGKHGARGDVLHAVSELDYTKTKNIKTMKKSLELKDPAFSAVLEDGRTIAVTNYSDDSISIIDSVTWRLVKKIKGKGVGLSKPAGIALLSNGCLVVANEGDRTLSIIDLTDNSSKKIEGLNMEFNRGIAALSGNRLAVIQQTYKEHIIKIIDCETGVIEKGIDLGGLGFRGVINDIASLPDGSLAVAQDNVTLIIDPEKGIVLNVIKEYFLTICSLPDGYLAGTRDVGMVFVVDPVKGKIVHEEYVGWSLLWGITFIPAIAAIAVNIVSNEIITIEFEQVTPSAVPEFDYTKVKGVKGFKKKFKVNPRMPFNDSIALGDGKRIAAINSYCNSISIIDTETWELVETIEKIESWEMKNMTLLSDGTLAILTGGWGPDKIFIIDVGTCSSKNIEKLDIHYTADIAALPYNRLAVISVDGKISIINCEEERVEKEIKIDLPENVFLNYIEVLSNGNFAATTDRSILIIDHEKGTVIDSIETGGNLSAISALPGGYLAAALSNSGDVIIIDTEKGGEVVRVKGQIPSGSSTMTFLPRTGALVLLNADKKIEFTPVQQITSGRAAAGRTGFEALSPGDDLSGIPPTMEQQIIRFLKDKDARLLEEKAIPERPSDWIKAGEVRNVELARLNLLFDTFSTEIVSEQMEDAGLPFDKFKQYVSEVRNKKIDHYQNDVAVAIASSDKAQRAWIREGGVQNPRDAIREARRKGLLGKDEGKIIHENFLNNGRWVYSIKDPVGMNLWQLVRYYFSLDQSSKEYKVQDLMDQLTAFKKKEITEALKSLKGKYFNRLDEQVTEEIIEELEGSFDDSIARFLWEQSKMAGLFGQGNYTFFADFDEFFIRTSPLDPEDPGYGLVNEVLIINDPDRGPVIKRWAVYKGKYRGTEVRRIKDQKTSDPMLESVFVEDALRQYAGAVTSPGERRRRREPAEDGDVLIVYNDSEFQEEMELVSRVEVKGAGEIELYRSMDKPYTRVTVDEIKVKTPGKKEKKLIFEKLWYLAGLHGALQIKLPALPLNIPRNDYFGEASLPVLHLIMKGVLRDFVEKGTLLPGYVEDYFSDTNTVDRPAAEEIAGRLNNGEYDEVDSGDLSRYLNDEKKFFEFLSHIRFQLSNGQSTSLHEIREIKLEKLRIAKGAGPREPVTSGMDEIFKDVQISYTFRSKIEDADVIIEDEVKAESIEPKTDKEVEEKLNSIPARTIAALESFEKAILGCIGIRDPGIKYYYKEEGRVAHMGNRLLKLNLYHHKKKLNELSGLISKKKFDLTEWEGWLYDHVELLVHESLHFEQFETPGDPTHQADETVAEGFRQRMGLAMDKVLTGLKTPEGIVRIFRGKKKYRVSDFYAVKSASRSASRGKKRNPNKSDPKEGGDPTGHLLTLGKHKQLQGGYTIRDYMDKDTSGISESTVRRDIVKNVERRYLKNIEISGRRHVYELTKAGEKRIKLIEGVTSNVKGSTYELVNALFNLAINHEDGGEILLALDEGLGKEGFDGSMRKVGTRGLVKRVIKEICDNCNDSVLQKKLRNIIIVSGKGDKLAREVSAYIGKGKKGIKINPDNVIVVTKESNRTSAAFKALPEEATITFVDDSELKVLEYYPIVELTLFTIARSFSSYSEKELEKIFRSINATIGEQQTISDKVITIKLKPAEPYEYDELQHIYKSIQLFLKAA